MRFFPNRVLISRNKCFLLYTIFYTCLFTTLWYCITPTVLRVFHKSPHLQTWDYRVPDVDGTSTSCRCARGPRMYVWPPPNGPEDLLCSNSTYDLTLCVQANPATTSKPTILQERLLQLQKEINGSGSRGNRMSDYSMRRPIEGEELLQWYQLEGSKVNGGKGGYEMYPLAINLTDTIQAINQGLPAPYAPITNPNMKLLRAPRTACPPTSHGTKSDSKAPETYDLIIIYRTSVFLFDDRERIRAATLDLPGKVRVVFSVGQPRSDGKGSFFHMNGGFDLQLPERAGSTADLWADRSEEATRRLFEEADRFGDIIIGDYVDTYVNLTYKMLTNHRWASVFCQGRADVFLIIDDDFVFNVNNILQYLRGISKEERRQILSGPLVLQGRVLRPNKAARYNKWALTLQEVPWSRYPTYVLGAACLIGADILDELIIAEIYTRFLWIDDVYFGFVVTKLPSRQFQDMKGFYLQSNNNDKALVSHVPSQFTLSWFADSLRQVFHSLGS